MARKVGQIIRRGERTWLVRMYLGRDAQTRKRKYFNHTIHGPAKQAQMYLTKKLRERDLRRGVEGIELTLDCRVSEISPSGRRYIGVSSVMRRKPI
jgi:hypothetical protein